MTWDEQSGRGETIQSIVDAYNRQSDSYHVTLMGGNEDKERISELLEGDQVDVYVLPYRYIQDNSISEKLIKLDKVFSEEITDFYPTMVQLGKNNNELKGLPWIGHSMSIIFNVDLCKQSNVNPYQWKSLQDMIKALQAIETYTEASGIGLVGADHHDITWMVNQFVYTFGGSLVEVDENGRFLNLTVQSEETKTAIDFYKNELGKYAQDNWTNDNGQDVLEDFSKGEIAFEIQGPWGITDIWKKGNPFEVGVIALSQIGVYSEVGPMMLSVSENTHNTEGALEFIRFLESDEGLEMVLDGEYDPKHDAYYPFRIPIKRSMEDSVFYKKYPEFRLFSEGFRRPSISSPTPEWATNYNEIYQHALHQIMTGEKTIDQSLEEVAK